MVYIPDTISKGNTIPMNTIKKIALSNVVQHINSFHNPRSVNVHKQVAIVDIISNIIVIKIIRV